MQCCHRQMKGETKRDEYTLLCSCDVYLYMIYTCTGKCNPLQLFHKVYFYGAHDVGIAALNDTVATVTTTVLYPANLIPPDTVSLLCLASADVLRFPHSLTIFALVLCYCPVTSLFYKVLPWMVSRSLWTTFSFSPLLSHPSSYNIFHPLPLTISHMRTIIHSHTQKTHTLYLAGLRF